MKKHRKKMVAPVVITVLVICYFIFYMWMGWSTREEIPLLLKILLLLVPAGFIGLISYMLLERIREIKGGEEDDLSKY
ncbi:hypothetical protein ACHAL6_05905 [Proteiniclasticum sp. C24MP]|uniref:hypothetical protein n=1 Tax=Proteiniclasticum sp. C24MP TaxID=3374101 RepID=UPI003754AB22